MDDILLPFDIVRLVLDFYELVRVYCKQERVTLVLRVFDEMRGAGITLDAPTKALLVRSLWREGKLREATLFK